MTGDIKHSKEQTHTRHCRKTSRNYYALEAQKLGQSEAFHKRFLTLNREEIGAGNLTNCCNPIAIRKNYYSTTCVNGWTKICFRKFGLLQKCYDLSILRAKKSMVMCSISLVCHVPYTPYTESQLQLYHMKNRNERTVLRAVACGGGSKGGSCPPWKFQNKLVKWLILSKYRSPAVS